MRAGIVREGDEIRLAGEVFTVLALSGGAVRLMNSVGDRCAVPLSQLRTDPTLELVSSSWPPLCSQESLSGVPPAVADRARWWERHLIEVLTGTGDAGSDAGRCAFDVSVTTLRQRELAKVEELQAAGYEVSFKTLQRQRRAYERDGLLGVVDRRYLPQRALFGRVDQRVVEVARRLVDAETDQSTGTVRRFRRRVARELVAEHGPDAADAMPSETTFYRLMWRLSAGKHTFGSARTRRSLAKQPEKPFGAMTVARPGEMVEIDSTPLDVLVVLDDATVDRVELTGMVDNATRSIPAAVLRPTTKAVDAALLLARALTPEPMRPGWVDALRMSRSVLPHHRLTEIDHRLEDAAARPVIAPETIVCDHGKAYLSQTFRQACCTLGINLQPAHPDQPTDKPRVERTLQSVSTLFAQEVAGYVGSSVEHRGKNADREAAWSIVELQALLDEWIVTVWQNRPHDGLRDPVTPGKALTPNEKYAALVEFAGYVPMPLTGEDYIELLPAKWRTINSYGIRINNRIYDAKALNPHRHQDSGVHAHKGQWEVHHDPYDVSRIWVRNHHDGGWMMATWTHLRTAPVPFGESIWQQARSVLAQRGRDRPTEDELARAAADLLDRASNGPASSESLDAKQRQVAARNRVTAEPSWPRPVPPMPDDSEEESPALADGADDNNDDQIDVSKVIPLPVFDARKEAKLWRL
ncbi:Mu transposase C-terminal domain-containing protein [Mycobacterium sp. pUA109]|uniref:Mu transposase C-terminal domain-containing protein n=1 Tax=Mycobacterium sp. pUA109 TaxID=3238982 RepID=UPI00351B6422